MISECSVKISETEIASMNNQTISESGEEGNRKKPILAGQLTIREDDIEGMQSELINIFENQADPNLEGANIKLHSEIQKREKECEGLRQKLSKRKSEIKGLKGQIQNLTKEKQEIINKGKEYVQQNLNKFAAKDKEIKELRKEIEELKEREKDRKELENQITELNEELVKQKQKNEELSSELGKTKKDSKEKKNELMTTKSEIENVQITKNTNSQTDQKEDSQSTHNTTLNLHDNMENTQNYEHGYTNTKNNIHQNSCNIEQPISNKSSGAENQILDPSPTQEKSREEGLVDLMGRGQFPEIESIQGTHPPQLQRSQGITGSCGIQECNTNTCQLPDTKISNPKLTNPLAPLGDKITVILIWKKEISTSEQSITYQDRNKEEVKLTWCDKKKFFEGETTFNSGSHEGLIVFPTSGDTQPVKRFEVKKEGMSCVMVRLEIDKNTTHPSEDSN